MTTTIKLHVNGRYRAEVKQDGVKDVVEVHGNYEGSPNPSGEHTFYLAHGSISNKFVISEYPVPEVSVPQVAQTEEISKDDVGDVGTVLGATIEAGKATGEQNELKADFKDE